MDHEELLQAIKAIQLEMENNLRKDIKLLAEGQELIPERMPEASEIYALKDRIKLHESVVKQHSIEINNLKKAN